MLWNTEKYRNHADRFNENDEETVVQSIDNSSACDWMVQNVPLFDCPDEEIEEVYYFRWWVYRKHIKETPDGFIITEFHPDVSWAGKYNSIGCPAGHHIYEGRWLRNTKFMDDYVLFWYKKGGAIRSYSN